MSKWALWMGLDYFTGMVIHKAICTVDQQCYTENKVIDDLKKKQTTKMLAASCLANILSFKCAQEANESFAYAIGESPQRHYEFPYAIRDCWNKDERYLVAKRKFRNTDKMYLLYDINPKEHVTYGVFMKVASVLLGYIGENIMPSSEDISSLSVTYKQYKQEWLEDNPWAHKFNLEGKVLTDLSSLLALCLPSLWLKPQKPTLKNIVMEKDHHYDVVYQ